MPGRKSDGEAIVSYGGVVHRGGLMHLFFEQPGIDGSMPEVHRIPRRGGDQDTRRCPGRAAGL